MKHKLLFAAVIAIALLCLNMAISKPIEAAGPPEGKPKQGPANNSAKVDITIDDAGNINVGGINLAALGMAPVDPQIATIAKNLGAVDLEVQDSSIALAVQGQQVVQGLWTPEQRQNAAALAANYGIQLVPGVQARVEEWVSSSDFDVTARYSNDGSHAVELSLSKPILVDIASNGQLAVENGPLATGIHPYVLQQIRMGGSHALACWDQGTLTTSVDGAELPTLVLNPAGVDIIAQALGLPINQLGTESILNARVGVDLSLPGGAHRSDAACGE
ncbi:MAG: hypothetical protein IT331_02470 [Anaerolineae bacterium]|nr:hypothetical protein [Anaerolineae bacterium]